jgi:uncharacterized membrane protein
MAGASVALAQTPSLRILSVEPGRRDSYTAAISADGRVLVGYSGGGTTFGATSYRWTADGGYDTFGIGPDIAVSNVPNAISADGSVVVGYGFVGGTDTLRPYRYANGTYSLLSIPAGFDNARAYGVSGDGSVVVGAMSGPFSFSRATRWTEATGTVDIGRARPGDLFAEFTGISRDGTTVLGHSENGQTGARDAYTWSEGDGWQLLPAPAGMTGEYDAYPTMTNDDGSLVVGTVRSGVQSEWDKAVLWANRQPIDLGTFGDRWNMSAGSFAGDGSIIIGTAYNVDLLRSHATIWLNGSGPMFLKDYLLSLGVTVPTGWTLEGSGISADGSTISGNAVRREPGLSFNVPFLVTIPAPGALSLGVMAMAFARRRRAVHVIGTDN